MAESTITRRSFISAAAVAGAAAALGVGAADDLVTSDKAWGPEGYLADKGLIALPDDERAAVAEAAQSLKSMEKPAK